MSHSTRIPKYVEAFFQSCEIDQKINRFSFFMIRYDGVVLYHNSKLASNSKSSIGALLGGVWQAAKALAEFIPKDKQSEGYRLSFDTSEQGVYIVPIGNKHEELYLGLIYHDEVNPGFIKSKMREMAASFNEFLDQEIKDSGVKNVKAQSGKKATDYLFDNITEAEMDHLFSNVLN
jgi:hypothetical protein